MDKEDAMMVDRENGSLESTEKVKGTIAQLEPAYEGRSYTGSGSGFSLMRISSLPSFMFSAKVQLSM